MPKTPDIQIGSGRNAIRFRILYEDRSILAIDKPPGWMLVPTSWQKTRYNLQTAILSSIAAGDFWARGRNLKFLRYVHRLDAETTGILLFGKSPGTVHTFGELFESRAIEKTYIAVVGNAPRADDWVCDQALAPDPHCIGRMVIDAKNGKDARTDFKVLARGSNYAKAWTLVEARPSTGRTHQIRVHLARAGMPILGDTMYGKLPSSALDFPLGLRATALDYIDPFTRKPVRIRADSALFLDQFGFQLKSSERRVSEGRVPGAPKS